MNRRKPRIDVAVVPMAAGEDRAAAVLRKAVAAALARVAEQGVADERFTAGYLAGFAHQQALQHSFDAEQDGGVALLAALRSQAPGTLREAVGRLSLSPRGAESRRAALGAAGVVADAGYLVGHLEALCRTRKLLKLASAVQGGGGADAFLTACDVAADRLQTHEPTAALRFDAAERAVVREAFAALAPTTRP